MIDSPILLRHRLPTETNVDNIVGALEQRGWMPGGNKPRQKVTDRLSELARNGEIERLGYGHYGPLPRPSTPFHHAEDTSLSADAASAGNDVSEGARLFRGDAALHPPQ